jgi:hypothetical protein
MFPMSTISVEAVLAYTKVASIAVPAHFLVTMDLARNRYFTPLTMFYSKAIMQSSVASSMQQVIA